MNKRGIDHIAVRWLNLLAVICLLFAGQGAGRASALAGSLVVGMRDEPAGLDSAQATDTAAFLVAAQVYDTLLRTAPGGSMVVPGLAQTWVVSADGRTWTFGLRAGVKFHDGTPLDAAAVLYNFNRWWDPDDPNHNGAFDYFAGTFGGFKGDPGCLISGLETSGSQHFIIRLAQPFHSLPSALTLPAFAIASPAGIKNGTLNTHPVGSGPFRFGAWTSGDNIRLDAYTGYWGGAPALSTLTFQFILDDADRMAAVKNNTIQVALDLPGAYAIAAVQDANLRQFNRPPVTIGYLGINRAHGPLGNALVRQAIAHAVNRPKLLSNHYGLGYQAASQFLPPSIWGYNPSALAYNYDPVLAVSELAQAGYPSGFTTTLSYRAVYRNYLPDPAGTAQAIREDLLAVGINATLVEYTTSEIITKFYAGELDLFLLGWAADYLHPDNFFTPNFCSPSNLGFGPQDSALCALLESASADPDAADQLALYQQASARVMEVLPALPLAHPTPLVVARRNITGLAPSPMGLEWYKPVFLASDWNYLPSLQK